MIVIVFLIVAVVQGILVAIAVGIDDSVAMRIVFNLIGSTLTAPIVALVAAVIYFRLREIEAGAPPVQPSPPAATPPPPPPPPPTGPTA